jgi:hypothetical protein
MNSMFTKIVRRVLGCILLLFGLNILLPHPFIPLPELPQSAAAFMSSLAATGYLLKTVALFVISFIVIVFYIQFDLFIYNF